MTSQHNVVATINLEFTTIVFLSSISSTPETVPCQRTEVDKVHFASLLPTRQHNSDGLSHDLNKK